jgi:transketolase
VRDKFADVIYEVGKRDKRISVLVADISPAGAITKFKEEFPERFVNTGVAEQVMIGIAAGHALKGMRPFCYTIATFALYRPFEMIRIDLCYQNLPVTIIGMGAGLVYSTLGGTHHSMEDVAVASAIPNMTVICPCDPEEMKFATEWCALHSKGPVYMRLGKRGEKNYTLNSEEKFEVGKIRKIKKGKNLAIITYGTLISMADQLVVKLYEEKKIDASLYSCHTIKPLDKFRIESILKNYETVIVMEEHVPNGGLSDKVKSLAYSVASRAAVKTYTLKDEFIHFYGTHEELLDKHGLSAQKIFDDIVK